MCPFQGFDARSGEQGKAKVANKAKAPVQVDSYPLQIKDVNYIEPLECLMVESTEIPDVAMEVSESEYVEKVKKVYHTTEEELVDFPNRCKLKGS